MVSAQLSCAPWSRLHHAQHHNGITGLGHHRGGFCSKPERSVRVGLPSRRRARQDAVSSRDHQGDAGESCCWLLLLLREIVPGLNGYPHRNLQLVTVPFLEPRLMCEPRMPLLRRCEPVKQQVAVNAWPPVNVGKPALKSVPLLASRASQQRVETLEQCRMTVAASRICVGLNVEGRQRGGGQMDRTICLADRADFGIDGGALFNDTLGACSSITCVLAAQARRRAA